MLEPGGDTCPSHDDVRRRFLPVPDRVERAHVRQLALVATLERARPLGIVGEAQLVALEEDAPHAILAVPHGPHPMVLRSTAPSDLVPVLVERDLAAPDPDRRV